MSASLDSVPDLARMQSKYSRQVLINSILGFTCTLGMGVFYSRGSDAYEDYKNSESMSAAIAAWDRVKINDTARNVFAVGAVFFMARALYYQVKRASLSKSKTLAPVLEMRYTCGPKMLIGLQKDL
jgi:hypothetical protein